MRRVILKQYMDFHSGMVWGRVVYTHEWNIEDRLKHLRVIDIHSLYALAII